MFSFSSRPVQALEEREQPVQAALHLLTFSPVGNPLLSMNEIQRQFFFNSMFRMLQLQSAENEQRIRQLHGKMLHSVPAASLAARKFSMGKKGQAGPALHLQQAPAAQEQGASVEKLILRLAVRAKKKELEKEAQSAQSSAGKGQHLQPQAAAVAAFGAEGKAVPLIDSSLLDWNTRQIERGKGELLRRIVYKGRAQEVKQVQTELAAILDDYARGDAEKAEGTLSEFSRRLSEGDYRADELGAVLLLVIEDQIWAGEEGGTESARPGGASSRVKSAIPEKIMQSAQESAVLRLASVREMLRYYFQKRPEDFRGALAIALGITGADAEDDAVLRARMASAATEIGSFALSQKILSAVKKMRGMDTKKCLFELGYRYDKAKKKLIVGKRTCGKPSEARGIMSALLSKFRKPGGK